MTINIKGSENVTTVEVGGRLDTITAPALEKVINEDLAGVQNLVLDLKGLEYISSAGLRVLLGAQKKQKKIGTMKLKNVREAVMEIFEITGFTDVLDIEY